MDAGGCLGQSIVDVVIALEAGKESGSLTRDDIGGCMTLNCGPERE